MTTSHEHLQQLLTQVAPSIQAYYQYIAAHPSWNIFYALGKNKHQDELIHSYFLASLLRTQIDGQFVFLRLFLEMLASKYGYCYNPADVQQNPAIHTEYNISAITKNYMSGGRIDILVELAHSTLIIENKIYAKDQPKQLYRYFKSFPQAQLLYLTLTGYEPEDHSVYNLEEEGGSYECLSYKQDILGWLQNCLEACNKPNHMAVYWLEQIKTALRQYKEILENLTEEGAKATMSQEIVQIANENETNFLSALHIGQNYAAIYNRTIQEKLIQPLLQFIQNQYNLAFEVQEKKQNLKQAPAIITGFDFHCKSWKYITIRFSSETYDEFTGLYGISQQKATRQAYLKNTDLWKYVRQDITRHNQYISTDWWCLIGNMGYFIDEKLATQLWKPAEQEKILTHFQSMIIEVMKYINTIPKNFEL